MKNYKIGDTVKVILPVKELIGYGSLLSILIAEVYTNSPIIYIFSNIEINCCKITTNNVIITGIIRDIQEL